MNRVKGWYCRAFQAVFRFAIPYFPYREPEVFDSVDAIAPVLKQQGIDSVLLVTDPYLRGSGVTKHLEEDLACAQIRCAPFPF